MTHIEAENIINEYWASTKGLQEDSIVQPISDLPCSPGKLRFAHFIYGEWLIQEGLLTKEIGDNLCKSYAVIHTLFVEDPEPINAKYREYNKKLEEGVILKDFKITDYIAPAKFSIEYNNFLAEFQATLNTA